jgi:hypothetical protein
MQIPIEIDEDYVKKIVDEMLESLVRKSVSDIISENDDLWEYINDEVSTFVKSEKFDKIVNKCVHNSEELIVDMIRQRIFDY